MSDGGRWSNRRRRPYLPPAFASATRLPRECPRSSVRDSDSVTTISRGISRTLQAIAATRMRRSPGLVRKPRTLTPPAVGYLRPVDIGQLPAPAQVGDRQEEADLAEAAVLLAGRVGHEGHGDGGVTNQMCGGGGRGAVYDAEVIAEPIAQKGERQSSRPQSLEARLKLILHRTAGRGAGWRRWGPGNGH